MMESPGVTAEHFAAARQAAQGLAQWPGSVPTSLEEAYAMQQDAWRRWNRPLGGVKVGRVLGEWAERLGVDRFIGPVDAGTIRTVRPTGEVIFPVIAGGTALLECEVLALVGSEGPDALTLADAGCTPEAALAGIAAFAIGIEVAGSPMAGVDTMGPLASIACFGNNNGAIVGPRIDRSHTFDSGPFTCVARIDGVEVGRGETTCLLENVGAALAFAFTHAARLGMPLREGQVVCTGALTGMHPIAPGQVAEADFGPLGTITCRAERQMPE